MLYIKEEHLEQKKQRQLRENIEEYLANSFCTMQTELELLEKHIHQNPESPTYSMDSEMLRDISLRLRAMADVSSSMAAILQGDADELRARTRALPFAERLRLFCERVNWEMKDLGYAGRTMYCTESPDICVLGDPVFMEAVLVNLILGMLKLENGGGCLSVNLSKNKKQAELRLFAKGACAAGKERLEDKVLKGYRYMSPALVLKDVGMEMRVMGAPAYYPLIEAGKNWYECKAGCELILDDTTELVFVVGTFGEKQKKKVIMGLPGLPERPNKTTRLSLSLAYVSQKKCRVVVKDLGFGEMFPSSGRVWDELVEW